MNLQLFALPHYMVAMADGGGGSTKKTTTKKTTTYDPNSIVDYLKQQGQDSSYSARKQLASQYGISGYKGTAEQNTKLLNTLKNGTKTTGTANKPAGTVGSAVGAVVGNTAKSVGDKTPVTDKKAETKNTTAPAVSKVSGVDQSTYNQMTSKYSPSESVTNAQNSASNALNALNSIGAPSVNAETMQALNTPFNASSAYIEAMNYTNSLLEKLSSGRTSYTDQIKDLMGQIQNRDKFSYDVETDTLFQQALASAMGSGKQAMQDTMGQASALTGGYASTYAQSAGNQAYNAYIEDAYNNLPEYYQMAMEAYNMEGQEMYNQLGMLSDADAQEYGRMYDSWNANNANAQNMYAQEYGAWQDSVNNAYNSANLQLQQQGMAYDQAYNTYGAMQNQADTLYAQEYQKWADQINNAMNVAGMQNSDYWNTQNFDESVRQYDNSLAQNQSQFEASLEQEDEWNQKELDYKNSALTQSQSQWEKEYGLQQEKWNAEKESANSAEEDTGNDLKEPTETQKQKALKAFNEGGEDEYYKYIDSLPSNIDVEAIDLYVNGDGVNTSGYGALPVEQRTFTKTKDTVNGLWGVDNNDVVEDQYGNVYRIDELPDSLRKALTKLKKGESYTAK